VTVAPKAVLDEAGGQIGWKLDRSAMKVLLNRWVFGTYHATRGLVHRGRMYKAFARFVRSLGPEGELPMMTDVDDSRSATRKWLNKNLVFLQPIQVKSSSMSFVPRDEEVEGEDETDVYTPKYESS